MDEPPQKKFRYETYTQKINAVSVDVGKSRGLSWRQDEIAEDASQTTTPLTVALVDLSLIHLQLPYIAFTKLITPLCSTLPLTLHNYAQLHGAFHNFYTSLPPNAGDLPNSGISGVLSLHHALIQTVLGECLPYLPSTVQDLLKVGALPAMDPALVEKTYSTLSLILRLVAPDLLKTNKAAQSALRESWSYVRRYLTRGDNKAYVRKCVSEAWSGVVRKARGDHGKRLVDVMTEGEGEGLDSVFAESLKGASHNLSSRAPLLFSLLLDHLFATETPSKPFQASLNNLLVSLTHHCSSTALQPIVEELLQRLEFVPTVKAQPVLAFISTLLMTRKGQRFPAAMLRGTMQKLNANVKALQGAEEQWKVAFVGCVVGSLLAGKLAEWLSPGVVLIEGVWNNLNVEDRFGFVNVLVETEWKGTEQFLLSHVAKTTITTLPTHPLATLTLLSTLATAGHLSGGLANVQAGRWRTVLVNALVSLLNKWASKGKDVDEEERQALAKMFVLLPHLPNEEAKFAPALGRLLDSIISAGLSSGQAELESEWNATQRSSTHLLGGLLACLANFVEQGADNVRTVVQETFCKGTTVEQTFTVWSWSREVVKGMAELRSVWSESSSATIATLEPLLKKNLSTHDSSLRLSVLEILASLPQPAFPLHESKASTSNTAVPADIPEPSDLLSLSLETESAGMTLKNVRERTTLISRLGRRILSLDLSSEDGARALDNCLVYLVAQLKVNFRPLYPETITTLASIAERYPAQVWEKLWTELVKAAKGDLADLGVSLPPSWAQPKSAFAEENEEEKEKEFGCPNLARVQKEVARWIGDPAITEDDEEVKAQITTDRLDIFNYEAQLVGALRAVPAIAEKHTRDIVPLFLQFVKPDGIVADEEEVAAQKLSVRLIQEKVGNYLQLFAKFVNPKAAFRTAELHALWLALLAKGEGKIQSLALDCLFTYKSPLLAPYQEHFRGMLDESRFRDELSKFTLGLNSEVIDPQHRPEVVPVAIRILYGVMTSRRGRTSSHQGPAARKQAALAALAGVAPEELRTLIDLMLEPFESFNSAPPSTSSDPTFILSDSEVVAPGKQQVGFLVMLGDVLKHMGPQTVEYWPRLFGTVLELVHRAQAQLGAQSLEEEGDADESRVAVPSRSVRGFGLKRISEFFKQPVNFDFRPYLPVIFSSVVNPRLPTLDKENTQSPSGLLELFAAWAMRPEYAFYLVDYNAEVLPQLYACLVAPKVKAPVISRIFDVVERVFAYADDEPANGETETKLIKPYVTALLVNLAGLVENTQGVNAGRDNLVRRQITILSQLSRYIEDGSQAARLVTLMSPMLRKPGRQVPEKVKVDILVTFRSLLPLVEDFADPSSKFFQRTLNLVSSLFQTMYAKQAREALANLLVKFSDVDGSFLTTTELVNEINAFSKRRIEEPDFDRRLAAFAKLNDEVYSSLTPRDWVPLIHNMLFFIQDPEELSIRSNASYALRRYIDVLAAKPDEEHQNLFVSIIFPGLRGCLRSKLELVRTEVLAVLAAAVTKCEFMPVLAEMRPLLAHGDDEANFFSNIHHIQVHRRARALRRLIDTCAEGSIRESTLATVFLPLVGHFVTGASEVSDHHLVNEAIVAVGRIAGELKWSRYNGLLHHYLKVGKVKAPGQKFLIRTVSAILDNFHFSMESTLPPPAVEETVELVLGDGDVEEDTDVPAPVDLQANARIADAVINRLLPQLNQFIQTKEETDDSIRIPVAFGVVKVAQALPEDSSFTEVSRVLTILSQILRSKDQDTRDLARDTMCKIAKTLGPGWLAHVIKEMRAALQRGPQLQVLAVVTHHILVYVTTEAREEFLNLDDAIADIVHVSAEVVWGQSGRDVATDGFKTKMREVRGAASRGYDSFQLVSRLVSPSKISQVLLPLRDIMQTSQAVKPMQQVDEALRRIALGLNSNPLLGPTELLSLCHTLISNNSQFLKPKRKGPSESQAARDFKVQMKREEAKEEDVYVKNAYKFVGFGLDLFVTAFRRGRFDFADVDILSRLGPMLPVIGNTLYSANAQVLILGLKAAAAMVKCPVPQVEQSMDVIVKQIFNIIKNAGGTVESEVAQTAIKTLAVVIRDCKTTEIKEKQLAYLLGVVNPDLEDHTRQAAIFTLLRSIVARRFVVPEIYDLMERISSIMVTSQSSHAQELCRVVLMQFLLDYPQGKGRLKTQMTFLARNLDYVYESGRISVMELLSAVFTKFSDELIHEYSNLFFVALVVTMANDDAEKCREMSGELIKLLFKRMDADQQSQTLLVLKSWVAKRSDDTVLARAAISVYSLLLDLDADETEGLVGNALPDVVNVLRDSASALAEAESAEDDSPFADAAQLDHALPYQALTAMSKILSQQPSLGDNLDWTLVTPHLLFPHEWVRLAAARVLGSLFAANPVAAPVETIGVKGKAAVLCSPGLMDIARKSCIILQGAKAADGERLVVSDKLAGQVVKLLWYIGKSWALVAVDDGDAELEDEDEETAATSRGKALPWLMSRLSFIARNLIIQRPAGHSQISNYVRWTPPLLSILRFFAGMVEHLELQMVNQFLVHILSPIYRILDDEGDMNAKDGGDADLDELRQLATEVREFVQNKVGTTEFSRVWEGLRKKVVAKRGERRQKGQVMAVSDPQAWAKRKEQRGDMRKENKKRKVKSFADSKQRERPTKRRA